MRVLPFVLLAATACGSREEPLRLRQRSDQPLADGATLKIGDIRLGGGALLRVVAGGKILAETEARPGDRLPFVVQGRAWEIEVLRLENHLTHEDYVHLLVRRSSP